jgi:hypothetical protein
VVAAWGAAAVVTLVEQAELRELQIEDLEKEVRRRFIEWHHLPITDVAVPDAGFGRSWPADAARLQALIDAGANVLIHCRGGLGRAGMVAARLLVERGVDPEAAMKDVRAVRAGAIETPEEEQWVTQGRKIESSAPGSDPDAIKDRAVGALVGLAVGDAVGTAIEFTPKPDFAVLSDMVGGGPFRLNAGEWTDDTASRGLALEAGLPKADRRIGDRVIRSWDRIGSASGALSAKERLSCKWGTLRDSIQNGPNRRCRPKGASENLAIASYWKAGHHEQSPDRRISE